MPIIQSAKKRVRVSRKATARNVKTKRQLRAAFKLFAKSPSAKSQAEAYSAFDKAAKKGVIHKNKAARLKRRAAAQAKAAGVKPAKAAKPSAKAPAKKPAAKKPAAKK